MKIKFKPTNLARARPKSKEQEQKELSPPEKLPNAEKKTSANFCSEAKGGRNETEGPEDAQSATLLATTHNLTGHTPITTSPPVTDDATPLSAANATTDTQTASLLTTPPSVISTPSESTVTEVALHDELPVSPDEIDTPTSNEATPSSGTSESPHTPHDVTMPNSNKATQDPIETLPMETAISACPPSDETPLNGVAGSEDHPQLTESGNNMSNTLTLEVQLALDVLAGRQGEGVSEGTGSKEKVVENGNKSATEDPEIKEKGVTGRKRPRRETKSKSEGTAKSNSKEQPVKSRASKTTCKYSSHLVQKKL